MSPSSEVFVVPSQLSFIIYFWSIINLNYSWFDDHNVTAMPMYTSRGEPVRDSMIVLQIIILKSE